MVLVFDVNGTLLDTAALAPVLNRILGPGYPVREWFNEVLLYAMTAGITENYREFGDIAIDVIRMAGAARKIDLTDDAIEEVRTGMLHMPPFDDVSVGLQTMRQANIRLAALSNSSACSLNQQLQNAGIAHYFEKILSVDLVRRFKPAPEVYRPAAPALGVRPDEILMVAAHHWDLLGAAHAGFRTALITRPGKAPIPGAPAPDFIAVDLRALSSLPGIV